MLRQLESQKIAINTLLAQNPGWQDYIFNQRLLMKCVSEYLADHLNYNDMSLLTLPEVNLLKKLQTMLLDDKYSGWQFKNILNEWSMILETIRNYPKTQMQFGIFHTPIFPELMKIIADLSKWFDEINVYPIFFKRFKCDLFRDDMCVNTENALYLYEVANDMAKRICENTPIVTDEDKIEFIDETGRIFFPNEDKQEHIQAISTQAIKLHHAILRELLESHIYDELDFYLVHEVSRKSIINTIRHWDVDFAIATKCATVQSLLLDSINFYAPTIMQMNLHVGNNKITYMPRAPAIVPQKIV